MSYDLALFQDGRSSFLAGRKAVGVERLSQRVHLLLLSNVDEIPKFKGGSSFWQLVENQAVTESDVRTALSVASIQVARQLLAAETDTDTEEDKLSRLQLTKIEIAADTVTVELNVISNAGTAATTRLPLTFAR